MEEQYYENYHIDKQDNIYNIFKRIFDVFGAIIGLIIVIPLLLFFILLIRLESPGEAIYTQERLGKDDKSFTIYKLRSMHQDAEIKGAQWAEKNDIRVTRLGRLMRLSRIDELPQLVNVLKGDMSIIGPRPERRVFVEKFSEMNPEFTYRTLVRPGLTGWAQVNGGYELSPEEKLRFDLYYITNMSLVLDVKILIKTIRVVIIGEGAR